MFHYRHWPRDTHFASFQHTEASGLRILCASDDNYLSLLAGFSRVCRVDQADLVLARFNDIEIPPN